MQYFKRLTPHCKKLCFALNYKIQICKCFLSDCLFVVIIPSWASLVSDIYTTFRMRSNKNTDEKSQQQIRFNSTNVGHLSLILGAVYKNVARGPLKLSPEFQVDRCWRKSLPQEEVVLSHKSVLVILRECGHTIGSDYKCGRGHVNSLSVMPNRETWIINISHNIPHNNKLKF